VGRDPALFQSQAVLVLEVFKPKLTLQKLPDFWSQSLVLPSALEVVCFVEVPDLLLGNRDLLKIFFSVLF